MIYLKKRYSPLLILVSIISIILLTSCHNKQTKRKKQLPEVICYTIDINGNKTATSCNPGYYNKKILESSGCDPIEQPEN
jgi:hypothetical protein